VGTPQEPRGTAEPEAAATSPEQAGLDPARLARADAAARRLLPSGAYSAVALAVSRHGALAHARCFGTTRYGGGEPVTDRRLFAIASVSTPVAAAAVMLLVEQGRLRLGTPVAELVPAFGRNGKAGVTLEHLLTHTAGIDEHVVGALPCATREEHYERLHRAPLRWPPGSRVAYSSGPLGATAGAAPGAPSLRRRWGAAGRGGGGRPGAPAAL
jgi:CubicO group peptidase (beta-lactamase class C family)